MIKFVFSSGFTNCFNALLNGGVATGDFAGADFGFNIGLNLKIDGIYIDIIILKS